MKNKCTQYESLFTFQDEEKLTGHISHCEDCALEDEKMKKVSELISEVKPYFQKRKKSIHSLRVACALLFFMVSGLTFSLVGFNTDISDTLRYGSVLSSEDLGFPVDDYGLIAVE